MSFACWKISGKRKRLTAICIQDENGHRRNTFLFSSIICVTLCFYWFKKRTVYPIHGLSCM